MSGRVFKFDGGRGSVLCSSCRVVVCQGLYEYTRTRDAREVLRPRAYEVASGEVYCGPACLPPRVTGSRVFAPEGTRAVERGWRAFPAMRDLRLGELEADNTLYVPPWAYLVAVSLGPLKLNHMDWTDIFTALLRREDLREALSALDVLAGDPAHAARELLEAELGHLWHWSPELVEKLAASPVLGRPEPKAGGDGTD